MKNSKPKTRFRFNFIDVLLIIVILTAAALLLYIFTSSGVSLFGSSKTVTIEYTIEVKQVREEFRDLPKIGDFATESVTQYDIGNVTGISYSPTVYTGINRETGSLVIGEYPERINITFTLTAKAAYDGNEYSVGGYKIAVGKPISIRVPYFTGEGYCTTLREVSSNG